MNSNIEVLEEYTNNHTPIKCRCKLCGYEWNPEPNSLLHGSGCPNCAGRPSKNTDIFIEELRAINPDVEVIGEYTNSHTPITVKCKNCEYEWNAFPYNLLTNHGCPICTHTGTSYMEQVILLGLKHVLGNERVISRDKTTIGMELDILIPSCSIAVEPGSWFYHKDNLLRDKQKRDLCRQNGIRLITIYDSYNESYAPFETDCLVFDFDLRNELEHTSLKQIIYHILHEVGLLYSFSDADWKKIESQAFKESRRTLSDDYIAKLKKIDITIELLDEFKSIHESVRCKCKKCGLIWESQPRKIIRCPNCSTMTQRNTDSFIHELKSINSQVEVLGEFENLNTQIPCRCKKCGYEWTPLPATLLRGGGCPNCAGRPYINTSIFVTELADINPDIQIIGEYVNNHTPIKCKCRICGYEWETSPKSLKRGHGCRNCAGLVKKDTIQFQNELYAINQDIEVIGEYVNIRTPILVKCKICGHEWEANPYSLLKGCTHKGAKTIHKKLIKS